MSDESMEARWRDAKIGERRDGRVCVWVECADGVDPRAEVLRALRAVTDSALESHDRHVRTAFNAWSAALDDVIAMLEKRGDIDGPSIDNEETARCESEVRRMRADLRVTGYDAESSVPDDHATHVAAAIEAGSNSAAAPPPPEHVADHAGAFAAWNEDAPAAGPSAPQEPPAAPDVPEAAPEPEALIKPRRARRRGK